MHELSIAQAVFEIASRHAQGRQVHRVEVRVGHLRQVVPDALAFAFELVCAGTVLEGSELAIEEVPAHGRCRACGARTTMDAFPLQCARCGDLDMELLGGEELLVDALELEEKVLTTEGMAHGC
jgi:hydrogenase nickel incorporation protein HypA/HybF